MSLGQVQLTDGHNIQTDEYVTVDLTKANRSTDLFGEDGEAFNPFRTPVNNPPLHGVSIGGGPHVCLGKMLALGVKITSDNVNSGEVEYGTIAIVLSSLLKEGIVRDPNRPVEIDENTTRRHFKSLHYVFDPAQ